MLSTLVEKLNSRLSLAKNSVLPAFFFGFSLISFYLYGEFGPASQMFLHIAFYVFSFAGLLVLLHFNHRKPAFFILTLIISYLVINLLKKAHPETYLNTPEYLNLCLFIPLNLAFFYFLPNEALNTKKNVYILLGIFLEFALNENLNRRGISFNVPIWKNYNVSHVLFILMNLSFFIRCSLNGGIKSSALFFAGLSVTFGFYYSDNASALCAFFAAAALIIILGVAQNLYYSTYKDVLTGLSSRTAFMINSKKFPLKYSIGIIAIDNYDKLYTVFGKGGINKITRMIANKIVETDAETPAYRYSDDEFIMIFKNEDREFGFQHLEAIRKAIASSLFQLSRRKKPLNLTVSCSVSEKKRSDGNSIETLKRAKKALQNTNQFAQNFTSKA